MAARRIRGSLVSMTTNTDSIPVVRAFFLFGNRIQQRRVVPTPQPEAIRAQEQRERDWERNLRMLSAVGMR